MPKAFTRLAVLVAFGSTSFFGTAERVKAQTYPIDCAILLCLSGVGPHQRHAHAPARNSFEE